MQNEKCPTIQQPDEGDTKLSRRMAGELLWLLKTCQGGRLYAYEERYGAAARPDQQCGHLKWAARQAGFR
jgi:hypothetical protein